MAKKLVALAFLGVLCASGGPALALDAAPVVFDPDAEGVTAPYLIPASRVTPDYPPAALRARYDATVLVRATVLGDGTVGVVDILDSTREKLGFEKSAIRAVQQWRFEPALHAGETVASYAWVRLRFNPPQENGGSGGFIAADFPRPERAFPVGGEGRLASVPPVGMQADTYRTAASDDQAQRFTTYGKPPCAIGCLYDRSDLIPPRVVGLAEMGESGR